jgi:hypothetical protein
MEPSPSITRDVSGKKRTKGTRKTHLKMTRNQHIDRQPRYCDKRPPMTGPRAGPNGDPAVTKPMYDPSSAAMAISATTLEESAMVVLLPSLCRQKAGRGQNEGKVWTN